MPPKLYRLPFDSKCGECALCNHPAVNGQAQVEISQVKAMVISAYPGAKERESGISLAMDINAGKNAGTIFRKTINSFFRSKDYGENFSEQLYITNALKCSPVRVSGRKQERKNITKTHLDTCKSTWLDKEIAALPEGLPILLAGTEAVKSILGFKESITKNSNQVLDYKGHPVVVTSNPVEWHKYWMFYSKLQNPVKEVLDLLQLEVSIDSIEKLNQPQVWMPAPLFSGIWFINRDLNLFEKQIRKYLQR